LRELVYQHVATTRPLALNSWREESKDNSEDSVETELTTYISDHFIRLMASIRMLSYHYSHCGRSFLSKQGRKEGNQVVHGIMG
jgi:hypothetical protein